jgi:hypothetical protein
MTLAISEPDRSAILKKIHDIPPIELRKHFSLEGKELWDSVKCEYQILHAELCAHFTGEEPIFSLLEGEIKDYLRLRRDQLLSFYSLIREAWEYLKPDYGVDAHGNRLTPGLLLNATLEMEWRGKIAPALEGYCVVNPRKSYELRSKVRKTKGFQGESPKFKQKEEQLKKDLSAHIGVFKQFAMLEVAILSHCRFAAKTNKYVKDKLDHFDHYSQELERFLYSYFDFRRAKSQIWERGERKTPSSS